MLSSMDWWHSSTLLGINTILFWWAWKLIWIHCNYIWSWQTVFFIVSYWSSQAQFSMLTYIPVLCDLWVSMQVCFMSDSCDNCPDITSVIIQFVSPSKWVGIFTFSRWPVEMHQRWLAGIMVCLFSVRSVAAAHPLRLVDPLGYCYVRETLLLFG